MTSACSRLGDDARAALERARDNESGKLAKYALDQLLLNDDLAKKHSLPICQDTGMAVFFVELGQDAHIEGGLLYDAINEGVRLGYKRNGYRASVLDPLTRINTTDNTPAVIHLELISGDALKITFLPKGFGSENMSKLYMLTPSDGIDGVKNAVIDAVRSAGSKPCPPTVIGVGIGGTSEMAMLIAKRQLARGIGSKNPDETLAKLEEELLGSINALGIGAQGFGGDTTSLAVHIGKYPTHIAALPVAVNIQCNAVRHAEVTL